MPVPENTPIIVGVGQHSWREADTNRTPLDALETAAIAALADTNSKQITAAIDAIGMIRFIADTNPGVGALFPRNPGSTLATRLGISATAGGPQIFQATIGGNTPQYMVNHCAGQLAAGEYGAVLIAGAELLATLFGALRGGGDISAWAGPAVQEPPTLGQERDGHSAAELAHGLYEPINTYPLFENALQQHLGHSNEQHTAQLAELCSRMSRVAANNPHAWRPRFMSPAEVSSVGPKNRYIGYPYTRAMNPILEVDMAAAVVMTTVGRARELGIAEERWIYLEGGADVNDIWHVSERPSLHTAPAIGSAWRELAQHAGIALEDISHFDIYSCFPSAVQIACNEIGLAALDERGVTVTGGLPFCGGPGNNYSLHAIASMVDALRASGDGRGLVTANGLYLTKHSLGLYSRRPPTTPWRAIDSAALQRDIDALPRLPIAADPAGSATVETYTVGFDRNGPKQGIVIARNAAGERLVANTAADAATLEQLLAHNPIGHSGRVRVEEGINILEL